MDSETTLAHVYSRGSPVRTLILGLVLEHYGGEAEAIANILLEKREATLKDILDECCGGDGNRKKEDIQYALLRLVQHAVVAFTTADVGGKQLTKYRILPERILVYGSLPCILALLPQSERMVLVELSIHGRLTAADIISHCGPGSEQGVGEALKDGLIADTETEEAEERWRANNEKKEGGEEGVYEDEMDTIIVARGSSKKRSGTRVKDIEGPSKRGPKDGVGDGAREGECAYIMSTSGALRFIARQACISAVLSSVGDSAANSLQLLFQKSGSVFGGEGIGFTVDELVSGRHSGALEECRNGLKALTTVKPSIVEQDGGRFRLVPHGAKTLVQSSVVGSIILSRLGAGALRVYLILFGLDEGPIDEHELYQRTMLGQRETRQAVYGLVSMGLVRVIEVPRSVDRNPTNSIFLFEITGDSGALANDISSSLLNVRDRLKVDRNSQFLIAASCHLTQLVILFQMCQ